MSTISNTVAIPADDPRRNLVVANPDNSNAQHLGVVGDTYTSCCPEWIPQADSP